MWSLEQSFQSQRSILLGKRKILGKYFQGNWSYLKWNGFRRPPAPHFQNTYSVHTKAYTVLAYTQSIARDTDTRTNGFSSDAGQFFWTDQCCSPAARTTDTLVYFSHAHFKFQHPPPHTSTTEKGLCVPGQEDKKGREISTSRHLHQNKNKQT